MTVRFTSFLGDNALPYYQQLVAYLSEVTGLSMEFVTDPPPDVRDRQVDAGQVHAVFTCGLPYVNKADQQPPLLRLIAAPVLAAERYQDRPIYFSDVIVHTDAPYQTFADLRGATFAYNETHSLSGYVLPLHHLLTLGETGEYFGMTKKSGSHAVSMDWVDAKQVDAAAIDSVVLEMELAQRPERAQAFRVIARIGPATMPPLAASPGLSEAHRQQLRDVLTHMHADSRGKELLRQGGLRRFAAVTDDDYQIIRTMRDAVHAAGASLVR